MPDSPVVIVFDIDGTLLHSVRDHQAALLDVYRQLGVDIGERPLGEFPDHTDSAIYAQLVSEARGSSADAEDFAALDAAMETEYRRRVTAEAPVEIPGARELVAVLAEDKRFRIVFATGSMRSVATQKLQQLGVDTDHALLVTASEYLTREEIVERAIALADPAGESDAPAISVGDGLWDQRTAANLGLPFVAVESGTFVFSDGHALAVGDLTELSPEGLLALVNPPVVSSTPSHTA